MREEKPSEKMQFRTSLLVIVVLLFWFLYVSGPDSFVFWEVIFIASLFSSAYLVKVSPKIKDFVGNFSQKDLLVFSGLIVKNSW